MVLKWVVKRKNKERHYYYMYKLHIFAVNFKTIKKMSKKIKERVTKKIRAVGQVTFEIWLPKDVAAKISDAADKARMKRKPYCEQVLISYASSKL
jgi:hypothetical protein